MTKKNRFLPLALLAVLTMLVLAACGGGGSTPPDTTPEPEPEPEAEPIELEFTRWPAESAPGVEVTLEWTISGDHDVLTLRQGEDGEEINVFGQESHTVTLPGNLPVVQYTLAASLSDEEDSAESDSIEIDVPYWVCDQADTEIQIPDPHLEARIRHILDADDSTEPLVCGDVRDIEVLRLGNWDENPGETSDLTGIQHFASLREFDGKYNEISDISALAGLTSLVRLDLDQNDVSDISVLSNLLNLEWIGFWGNNLTDLTPLENLTDLEVIYLSENSIQDLSPLAGLTEARILFAIGNDLIEDISPLENMRHLQVLRLGFNAIRDISVLAGLEELVWLELKYNQIEDITPLANLPNLFGVDLEENYITDLAPLLDNDDFPAELTISLPDPLPEDTSTVDFSSNCLDEDSLAAAIQGFEDKGVAEISRGVQREEACNPGELNPLRSLRLQQFRESGGIR